MRERAKYQDSPWAGLSRYLAQSPEGGQLGGGPEGQGFFPVGKDNPNPNAQHEAATHSPKVGGVTPRGGPRAPPADHFAFSYQSRPISHIRFFPKTKNFLL